MGLLDTNKIDFLLKRPDSRCLYLVVFDSGDILEQSRRYELVLEKLMLYADYVASGKYREQEPEVAAEDITLCVVCRTALNDLMKRIVSISPRHKPDICLPVIVETQEEFFRRTKEV